MPSMQWLFRSNIPRHRRSILGPDLQKRNLFGMGEVLSVLANVRRFQSLLSSLKLILYRGRIPAHRDRPLLD